MKRTLAYLATAGLAACLVTLGAQANVLQGISPDPVGELNTLYAKICNWKDGETIPTKVVDFTTDGVDDYLLSYDLPCRGQQNAFSGTEGMARQIWVSASDNTWVRLLDANARDLRIETRGNGKFVVLQHAGHFCMTADAAPCFLTLEFKDNALVWASDDQQHPSMNARLRLQKEEQKDD